MHFISFSCAIAAAQVPLGGFANLQGMRGNQRFSIHKAYGDGGLLPSAHTCFNQVRGCCDAYLRQFPQFFFTI
jgi:hypothetical protein